jgi:hypothetical protein
MKAVYRAEPLPDQLPANKRPNIILFLTDDQARHANAITRCIAKLTGLNPPALDGSCFSILPWGKHIPGIFYYSTASGFSSVEKIFIWSWFLKLQIYK